VTCGNAEEFRPFPPSRPPETEPQPQKAQLSGNNNDGHKAVALPGGRCSSANIRSYTAATGAATTTPGAALQPADRLRRLLVAGHRVLMPGSTYSPRRGNVT